MKPNKDNFDLLLLQIRQHPHEPKFHSALLEAIARQKPQEAARAIRAIKERGSEYEKWLHRDLFFAAECLAANIPGLQEADGELGREILLELVGLEVRDEKFVGQKVRDRLFNIFCSFKDTEFQKEALELLKERSNLLNQWRWVEYRVAFGEEEDQEEAIAFLLERLEDKDWFVKSTATELLGNFGISSETALSALVARLEDEYDNVRLLAAEALGKLGNSSPTVVSALVARLEDRDEMVRYNAAEALGNLRDRSQTVVNALMARLKDKKYSVGWSAVEALCKLGYSSEPLVSILAARQKDCQARSLAAENSYNFGDRDRNSVRSLVARLEDENPTVRGKAALALGNLGDNSETVLSALLALLEDESYHVRWRAASALGKLGNSSPTVVSALIARLEDDKDSMRLSVAYALGNLGKKSSDILAAVTQWLEQHQDTEYLGNGVDALWDIVAEEQN